MRTTSTMELPRLHKLPATLVRPYRPAIRDLVLGLVRRAGWELDPLDVVVPGTSDEDAVARIVGRRPPMLIAPFHGHRGPEGEAVHGFTFLALLHRAVPAFPWRVIMPVSATGAAALGLVLKGARTRWRPAIEILEATLVLEMDQLDEADAVRRLREHLAPLGARATGS